MTGNNNVEIDGIEELTQKLKVEECKERNKIRRALLLLKLLHVLD